MAVVVLLPNAACDEVKPALGTAAAGSTKLMFTSVEAVSSIVAPKLKSDFALCTISVDVLGFSLVKLPPLNENMTLFATSSFTSEARRFFGTPPDSFWSSLDAGGWNCESCGIPKQNAVCVGKRLYESFFRVSDADGDAVATPKPKPVETAADVHASAVLGILFDVTLGSANVKHCMFDEEALSDSVTGTPATEIPKLNFVAECDSEPGLAPSHATHFSEFLLLCTIQIEQLHIPSVFFMSPNEVPNADSRDDVGVGLVANAGPFVSQA
jgi:hypothetical protein